MTERVLIFDTTLRDGEQSPGATMNQHEKLQLARQLEKLGVDTIEAGFPASSEGDQEGVRRIAREIKDARVVGLARTLAEDINGLAKRGTRPATWNPYFSRHERHPSEVQIANVQRRGGGEGGPSSEARAIAFRLGGILL